VTSLGVVGIRRTASLRTEPNSRKVLACEQQDPSKLLHLEDTLSRPQLLAPNGGPLLTQRLDSTRH